MAVEISATAPQHAFQVFPDPVVETIRVGTYLKEQEYYRAVPAFQRSSHAWPLENQRMIPLAVISGRRIGPFIVNEVKGSRTGRHAIFRLIDGLQRTTALYEFVEGKLRLPSSGAQREAYRTVEPLFPGKGYQDISDEAVQAMMSRKLTFEIYSGLSEEQESQIYIEHNMRQIALTKGELLKACLTDTMKLVCEITSEHPFWWRSEYLKIENNRAQHLQSMLYILMLELFEWPLSLRFESQLEIAEGDVDDYVRANRAQIKDMIMRRLSLMRRMLGTFIFRAKTDVIMAYQMIASLEEWGFDLDRSEPGCLSQFYHGIKFANLPNELASWGNLNPLSLSTYPSQQRRLWYLYHDQLLRQMGLYLRLGADRPVSESLPEWMRRDPRTYLRQENLLSEQDELSLKIKSSFEGQVRTLAGRYLHL